MEEKEKSGFVRSVAMDHTYSLLSRTPEGGGEGEEVETWTRRNGKRRGSVELDHAYSLSSRSEDEEDEEDEVEDDEGEVTRAAVDKRTTAGRQTWRWLTARRWAECRRCQARAAAAEGEWRARSAASPLAS